MLISLRNVPEARGELSERITLNAARLCAPVYRPWAIYTQDKNGWPGDWEGRTLLALVSHFKCTGREPAYLDRIIREIPGHLNERGYIGRVLPEGLFDEQQLSGHNWLLRGLIEYYLLTGDRSAEAVAKSVVSNLYLPLSGLYRSYPLSPDTRRDTGSYSGNVSNTIGSWIVSTDTGCAFMCLDGLSSYYEVFKNAGVLTLLEEMTEVFSGIDFAGIHMQTHAALSALRGIIRLYRSTGDGKYLETAKRLFDIYIKSGMTENYANFNWFGRFDSWTEPCAVTDSLMVSTELYKITSDVYYLKLAARIYYNAFCYGQRYNGGFGTDTTVGPFGRYLKPSGAGISEAYWCCTMRGAEGLSYVCANQILCDEDSGDIAVTFGGSFKCFTESLQIDFCSSIPYEDNYKITLYAKEDVSCDLKVFNGSGFDIYRIIMNKGENKTVKGNTGAVFHEESAFTAEGKKYFFGNLLLGTGNPKVSPVHGARLFENGLQPLGNMKDVTPDLTPFENRQIVF